MPIDELLADQIRTLLFAEPGFSERKMFGGLCFMIHGHMTAGITRQNDLMLRVGPDAYQDCLQVPGARPMDFTGRPMKGPPPLKFANSSNASTPIYANSPASWKNPIESDRRFPQ